MEERKTHPHHEARALDQIVDAMLDVESSLENATVEEWSRILTAACRRQKMGHAARQFAMASPC